MAGIYQYFNVETRRTKITERAALHRSATRAVTGSLPTHFPLVRVSSHSGGSPVRNIWHHPPENALHRGSRQ